MSIALVANVGRSGTGTTASIDTTGANLLVAVAGWTNTSASIPAISDNKSNTWIPIHPRINSGACGIWISLNPTVGSGHTFSVSGGLPTACFAAFSGCALEFAAGKCTGNSVTGTSLAPGSVTPSINNCLLIAGLGYRDTTTISVDSGFTITDQFPFIGGTVVGSALAYLIQTSAAASNPTFSWTNSAVSNSVQLVISPTVSASTGGGSYAYMG